MYRMSQTPLEMNRLETPDSHDSDGSTYVRIRALWQEIQHSGVCRVFVYLFPFPIQIWPFSLNSSNYGKYRISPDR